LITALLTLLLGDGGVDDAGAAPASSPAKATYPADPSDPTAQDETPDDENNSVEPDDTVEYDLDFCGLTENTDAGDTPDDPAADDEATDPEDVSDDAADEGDDAETGDDPACDDEAAATTTEPKFSDGPQSLQLKSLLNSGTVDGGSVTMNGPGSVTQELFLPAGGATTRALRAGGATTKKTKANGKLLAGSVTKTVKKAGKVTLKVRLNRAGRSALRKAKKDVTITVKTVTHVKGKKAKTKTGTVRVKVKAVKRA
jgi:hypothetical protein